REEFHFHELALEDCLHPHQRPKIEQYDRYFFMVAYGASPERLDIRDREMAMFVGPRYLVTVRKDPPFDLSAVEDRLATHPELSEEGAGHLLYVLLDHIVDGYFVAVDAMEDRSQEIEEQVLEAAGATGAQGEIFLLRKDLIHFRRAVAPLRDVLDVLQQRRVAVVTERLEPYYRDVYDHVLRVTDFIDSIRDLLSSALDAHLSVVSNRLNEVMKKLTAWASIILVPTLIAGVYGMNFEHMPELGWLFGYPFALGLMATAALLLYRTFKRRDWF
ncbi:MAG TPA: magnesium/cobalt transporter CorA, partial [Actinomycetota bacterium]|nr:magnesium/cobalt transporter CorA [Actinomycetota bacterium]